MAAYTAIDDAGIYFNPKLFTGTGGSLAVTGVGFQPDFVWQKNRSITANHLLTDAVRGTDSQLYSNSSSAEGTLTNVLTSFDSDGFTAGTSSDFNGSGNLIVTWNWKAGTTSGIATDGNETITPSGYSFNQAAGFSIIEYTGTGSYSQKFPHGLGVAPDFVVTKAVSASWDWGVYHSKINGGVNPGEYALQLSDTDAQINSDSYWDDTAPTAFNVSLGDNSRTNVSGSMLAYCFAAKQGYSKFGGYTGNGNVDGTFIYTGFRPAFLIIKRYDSTNDWKMMDDKRIGYNVR